MPTVVVAVIVLLGTSAIAGLILFLGLAQAGRLAVAIARKLEPEPRHPDQFDWMVDISRQAAFSIATAFAGALLAVLVLILFVHL